MVATGAPMDEHPFPVVSDADGYGLHRGTALGSAVAWDVVEVAAPQTVGAVVSVRGPLGLE